MCEDEWINESNYAVEWIVFSLKYLGMMPKNKSLTSQVQHLFDKRDG